MVFNDRHYETRIEKTMNGHDNNVLNEASMQVDGTKHDVDNLVNKSDLTKPDVGDDANNCKH